MTISVFDLFKIGIGPSSSHTVGPMRAAHEFVEALRQRRLLARVARIEIVLHGALAATGRGHATDCAVIMGLMGERPELIDPEIVAPSMEELREAQALLLDGRWTIGFVEARDMRWDERPLPRHPNALSLTAHGHRDVLYANTYYSVGGGFVVDAESAGRNDEKGERVALPYAFDSADQLLALCREHDMSIAALMLENEKAWRSEEEIRAALLRIWRVMQACVARGISRRGTLPGGLSVKRRAALLHERLLAARAAPGLIASSLDDMAWVNLFALAVNEENAAGGRMVTAPTNGAAGIIPAVLHYYLKFQPQASEERDVVDFLLTAGAIGILCKRNASISGAEVGCQGEVGSACAMAAAGLAQLMGGTPAQVENAAEIGLEHNLGLTCDPVGGLVQIPCIERNAIAAVKAINAAQMALHGDGCHHVSLDKVIYTMRETGRDMQDKYKETSRGGLAVSLIEC